MRGAQVPYAAGAGRLRQGENPAAPGGFRPMCLTKQYEDDPAKGPHVVRLQQQPAPADGRHVEHVYQTIFLRPARPGPRLPPSVFSSIPRQRFAPPLRRQGIGGETTGGIAAAYRLGAECVKFDGFAEDFFRGHLLLSHGVVFSWEEKRRRESRTRSRVPTRDKR